MKVAKKLPLVLIILSLLIAIAGCRKTDRDEDVITYASLDNGFAESIFNGIFMQLHAATLNDTMLYKPGFSSSYDGCVDSAKLVTTAGNFPMTLTCYYSGGNCDDGKTRDGRIIAVFSGRYQDSLSVINVSWKKFKTDDFTLGGTATITNRGRNTNGNMLYSVIIRNGFIANDTTNIEWACNRTWEWTEDESTAKPSDDEFLISGTANGRTTKGNPFSATITTALEVTFDCNWALSGMMDIAPNNLSTRELDYGNACDNTATVTINNTVYTIQIP